MIKSKFFVGNRIIIMHMLIFLGLTIAGCNERKGIRTYKAFYPFGALWKLGKIKNDSIIVDTLKIFWPSKKIQEIRVYDVNGILNGCSTHFYPDGEKQYVVCFKNDKPIGYAYEYYSKGSIMSKVYRLNKQVGNIYHYNMAGDVDTFSFFDFSFNSLIEKHYTGKKLIRQTYKSYFLDTILPTSTREYLNLGFIVAKPPYESVELMIYKLNNKEKVYDSIPSHATGEFDSIKIKLDPALSALKLVCRRNDSLINQSTIEEGIIEIEDSK